VTEQGTAGGLRGRLRTEFVDGPRERRLAALDSLLRLGGVLLSNDGELLSHIDTWLAWGPLDLAAAGVAARQVERDTQERQALLVRGSAGRIRDRIRAAHLLGALDKLDEEAEAVLRGLLRDPVDAVWRSAGRAAWRQAARTPRLLEAARRTMLADADGEVAGTLRRHLAGGLAGLLPGEPALCAELLAAAARHEDVWTRAAAALSCAESVVLVPVDHALERLFHTLLDEGPPLLLGGMATGLRDAGRTPAGRPAAQRLRPALPAAVARCRSDAPDDQLACERAVRVLACLDDELSAQAPFGARFERVLRRAVEPRRESLVEELAGALDHAAGILIACGDSERSPDRARRCAGVADLRDVVERLFNEDQIGPLVDVVARTPAERQRVRHVLRKLQFRAVAAGEELARSKHFLEQREGMSVLSVAMDSQVQLLRERSGELLARAREGKTRRQAAGALARLLDRLRLDDAEGFLDIALRLLLQPATVQPQIMARVADLSPDPATRSFLLLASRVGREVAHGGPVLPAAERIEALLRGCPGLASTEGGGANGPPHPAVAALEGLARVLRFLAGERPPEGLSGLAEVLEALGRGEHNLAWDVALPRGLEQVVEAARALGRNPAPERLAGLAEPLERELFSVLAAALGAALRRAARPGRRRPRTASLPETIRPGDVLHGHEVVRVLSTTNFSIVCLALRQSTRRRVVLKCPTPAIWGDPSSRELFLREGHLLQVLPSEHVVRVEELFEEGPPMLVVQHLRGRTLDQCLGMDRRWLFRRCLDILRGLRHIHDFGVVHRDLKPGNVIVVPSGRAVLIDFGIAYLAHEVAAARESESEPVVGTPVYMAPEQWSGLAPTPATDIYALGAMIYELLAGRVPFPGDNIYRCIAAHLGEPPPPLDAALSPALRALVEAMLAKHPGARPGPEDIRDALENALAEEADWAGRDAPEEAGTARTEPSLR
jgi:predicted Ser/Thr protein kinase